LSVRKSGKAQAEERLIHSSNEVNQNNHRINVKCAHCGGGMKFLFLSVSFSFCLEVSYFLFFILF